MDVFMDHAVRLGGIARRGQPYRDLVTLLVPIADSVPLDVLLADVYRDLVGTQRRSKEVRNVRERLAFRLSRAASL